MNVTDVDDRIIQKAREAGAGPAVLHRGLHPRLRGGHGDVAAPAAGRDAPGHRPHPGDDRPHRRLRARGHTYDADGSVYFRIASFPEYGRLARLDVAGIQAGARVDTDKYDKENARDFVLWKSKSDEPEWAQWDAPFGTGPPGLAHRVLRDEHEVPRRDVRPARGG
jgi:cysteinyl-tRNA synthetase